MIVFDLCHRLAWLSSTACQVQQCRRIMEVARSAPSIDSNSVQRWRWLVPTPRRPQQTRRNWGEGCASACEAIP
ncbi:hypothetical protein ACNJRW_15470 [Stenotrophomonas maltophilia]